MSDNKDIVEKLRHTFAPDDLAWAAVDENERLRAALSIYATALKIVQEAIERLAREDHGRR